MNIVQVRSPFKIIINEPTQLLTQVKLYIWNQGDTEPTTPTYTFSKAVPSIASRECVFNISNQLQEYINPISAVNDTSVVEDENPKSWCFFKVERYSGTSDKDFTLLDTTDYIGLNGFTDYMSGNQVAEVADFKLLDFPNAIYNSEFGYTGYFNLLIDTDAKEFELDYDNSDDYIAPIPLYNMGILLLKVPYVNFDFDWTLPFKITLRDVADDLRLIVLYSKMIEECKYTPVECTYQNSFGGWRFLTFYKAQTNSITVKGSEFNFLPNKTNYNPLKGQSKVFNLNGNQSVKLNTGWVDENYDVLIRDLLLSETVLIDNKPAMVKSKSQTYKTQLKDKMMNYEIEFDYAFDLINNVV
jgi:hypothetical protein